jgi:hypothetical protein
MMLTAAKTPSFSDVDVLQLPGPKGGIDMYGFDDFMGSVTWIPIVASVAGCPSACTVQFHGKSAGIHWDTHVTSLAMVTSLHLSKPYSSSPQVLLTQLNSARGSFPKVHASRHPSISTSPAQKLVVLISELEVEDDVLKLATSAGQASLQEGRLPIESRDFNLW